MFPRTHTAPRISHLRRSRPRRLPCIRLANNCSRHVHRLWPVHETQNEVIHIALRAEAHDHEDSQQRLAHQGMGQAVVRLEGLMSSLCTVYACKRLRRLGGAAVCICT